MADYPPLPVPIGALPAGGERARLRARPVEVPDAVVERLRSACAVVDTDPAAVAEAGRDWWPLALTWARAGQVPMPAAVVVRPASTAEVSAVLTVCQQARLPVTAAAGRSGVCGASVPKFGGVALDLTGLEGIVDVAAADLLVRVRAGTNGLAFETALRGDHGLTAGHWPQSIALSSVGGWVACRGAGQYSTRYGKAEDIVAGLEVVLADGRVIRTGGRAPREAAGPDLTALFVGSEGTLGVITAVTLRCHDVPRGDGRAAYGFGSFEAGLDACRRVLRRGATPAVLRLYDAREARRYGGDGAAVLLVLDEAEPTLVDATMAIVAEECGAADPLDPGLVDDWLSHRNDVSALGAAIEQDLVVDTCEIAAHWSVLPAIYAQGCAAARAVPGTIAVSAHQSHAYPGGACLYFTFAGAPEDGDTFYAAVWSALVGVTRAHGGALSHHHGIGIVRGDYLAEALGPAYDVLRAVKDSLDPAGILNPGGLGLPSPFGSVTW